jgi:hypothetical protein
MFTLNSLKSVHFSEVQLTSRTFNDEMTFRDRDSISPSQTSRDFQTLDFSGQRLNSIIFPDFSGVRKLVLDDVKLTTFANLNFSSGLEFFSCFNAPISISRHFVLMAAIVFGPTLRRINGATISTATKAVASTLTPFIREYLLKGFLLMNLKPVRLLNPVTRNRKMEQFREIFAEKEVGGGKATVKNWEDDDRIRQNFEELTSGFLKDLIGELTQSPTRSRKSSANSVAKSKKSGRSSVASWDVEKFDKQ